MSSDAGDLGAEALAKAALVVRTARVQEVHATVLHVICELVEMELKD